MTYVSLWMYGVHIYALNLLHVGDWCAHIVYDELINKKSICFMHA